MLFLLVLIILFLVPIKIELSGKVHNLEFQSRLQIVFLYCIPLSVSIYNMKDEPWRFKIILFSRVKDGAELTEKMQRGWKRKPKKVRQKLKKDMLKRLFALKKYIRSLEITGRIGIKERADITALIAGCLNGIIYPGAIIGNVGRVKVYFIPEYTMDVVNIEWKCIISMNAANIIHEGIRYYLQRRK